MRDEHYNSQEKFSVALFSIRLDGLTVGPDWSKITECPHKSSCTRPFMRNTSPMSKQATNLATMQDLYVVSGFFCLLEHTTACRPTVLVDCLLGCTGIASHGRYDCTQFIIRYHLYCSTAARPAHRSHHTILKTLCLHELFGITEILVLTKTTIQF